MTRNFTLNIGVRYEFYPMMNRGDGRGVERWDPSTNLVYLGGVGNVPLSNGITVSKKLIAPRIGFAWRLGDKTVIRSGYGITFNPMVLSRPLKGLYPAAVSSSWVAPSQYTWYSTLTQGIPDVATPDYSSGVVTLPATVNMGPRSPYAGELHRGYIQSWNLTIERKLPATSSCRPATSATRPSTSSWTATSTRPPISAAAIRAARCTPPRAA